MSHSPGPSVNSEGRGSLSPSDRSPRGELSVNGGSQRHDDPFQKFFEDKDHMHKDSPNSNSLHYEPSESGSPTFTPFEMSILHALLASSHQQRVGINALMQQLEYYIRPIRGGGEEEYLAKAALLYKALRDHGHMSDDGDVLIAETASLLESNPSAFGLHLHIGAAATPATIEYLLTNEKLTDEDHAAIAERLMRLDTEKDGVLNLTLAFREMMRLVVPILSERDKDSEDPTASEEEAREIVRRIFNTASINSKAGYAVGISDFIEAYAMEVYIIPPEHRSAETAALTRRFDLSDYSLLWAAINNIRGIDAAHVEAALTEAAATEGVVADECSLYAIVKSVVGFIESEMEGGGSADSAMQKLSDLLVMNPTALHIPVMAPELRQEVAARKLLLYFKPSAVLSVLHALLLEDVRGDGVLSKPMTEAALMTELSSSSHRQHHHGAEEGDASASVDEVEEFAGVDQSRVEEMIRNVLLSAGVSEGGQEVNLSHFIDSLIEHTPVLPSRYCANIVVPFSDPPVQLNELEHLQKLLTAAVRASGDALANPTRYGCIPLSVLRQSIDTALVSQKENTEGKARLVEAFKEMSLCVGLGSKSSPAGFCEDEAANGGGPSAADPLIDIEEPLSVAVFEAKAITFHISSLSDYHAATVVARRVSKGNVRRLARAFIALDVNREKRLTLESFRDVMAANPKYLSREALEQAFEDMDIDMDGSLCLEEFISSFNNSSAGPALSKAQLSSLTMRRMSVKELHQGTSPPRATVEESSEEAKREFEAKDLADTAWAVSVAGAINSPSKKAALLLSLAAANKDSTTATNATTTGLHAVASPIDGVVVASPHRRSTKSLAPHHDASGVPIDDADLRAAFERYDTNNNGFISRREFAVAYRQMENFGLEPSDRDIENLFSKVCGNRPHITFNEFSLLMLRRSRM